MRELLTLCSQVSQLHKPELRVITAYESFSNGAMLGGTKDCPKSIISGDGSKFLSDPASLVTLQKPSDEDILSRSFQEYWLFQ